MAVVPVMLFLMVTFLMIQLQSFSRLALVLSVVPMGVIGVVFTLLLFNRPLGFVAILGILALFGMVARNAVILIEQVEIERAQGTPPWDAVIAACLSRFRPIMLTAISTVLGMIPIAFTVFWGPMAFAIMGGIARGDGAHADLPAGAVRGVLPDQGDRCVFRSGGMKRDHESARNRAERAALYWRVGKDHTSGCRSRARASHLADARLNLLHGQLQIARELLGRLRRVRGLRLEDLGAVRVRGDVGAETAVHAYRRKTAQAMLRLHPAVDSTSSCWPPPLP